MRLSIITDDKTIYKDGEAYSGLDVSYIPATVHALQWYDTYGEIEYKSTGPHTKPANDVIDYLPDWANSALAIWDAAKAAQET
jgi:hypothetical protein